MGSLKRRWSKRNAPNFRKRLTAAMLKKSERVVIPKDFVRQHGDVGFHDRKVLYLTGPSGKSRSVTLGVRGADKQGRVYLRRGWIGFARENGFQMGDEVIFRLIASSSFLVDLCSSQSLELKARASTKVTNSSKPGDEADHGTSGGGDGAITSESAPQHHKLSRQELRTEGTGSPAITNHEETRISPRHVNSGNTAGSDVPTTPSVEVVPQAQKLASSKVREAEYSKYPGLKSAVTANSRFPQFVHRLTPCSLKAKYGPELPVSFVREHGDQLQERLILLGPSDHLRGVHLKITRYAGRGRVYLTKGWRKFALENEFSKGDVLLFSLVELSAFVVKMFPGAS